MFQGKFNGTHRMFACWRKSPVKIEMKHSESRNSWDKTYVCELWVISNIYEQLGEAHQHQCGWHGTVTVDNHTRNHRMASFLDENHIKPPFPADKLAWGVDKCEINQPSLGCNMMQCCSLRVGQNGQSRDTRTGGFLHPEFLKCCKIWKLCH